MNYLEAEASLGAARADRSGQGGTTAADCDEYSKVFKGRRSDWLEKWGQRSLSAVVLNMAALLCSALHWAVLA